MDKPISEEDVFQRIKELTHVQMIAFIILICERLLPCYFSFYKVAKWGNPEIFRRAIDVAWKKLVTGEEVPDIPSLINELESNIPDLDDFEMSASAALHSSVSVISLLEFLVYGLDKYAIDASREAIDIVYQTAKVENLFAKPAEIMIPILRDPCRHKELKERQISLHMNHPIMQQELATQLQDINLVRQFNFADLEELRKLMELKRQVAPMD